ncbi:2,4-dichlorophenol hydroxylase [Hyphodiscus hymeniophilus]|uniref:2,4-dichlorophenol hydroxylase n=1 Tax=Hyphodiscus hymeniophilus TaxID=353542 RepID=A0A9P6VQZ9_9HELO|nr:2,4-dichlorophenol hydroxylase [Hyphodiscus hymeniophilus]
MAPMIDTDFLVVGLGPAGAALASFLAQNEKPTDLKGIAINKATSTADTPRAHSVNPFAIECLRDIGLEDDAKRLGVTGNDFKSMRWCRSMVGEEYGKVHCYAGDPDGKRDLEKSTPCDYMDLPQTYLEPMLVKYASHNGFQTRFSTDLVSIEQTDNSIICTVKDAITQTIYQIRSRYLFGADGGRSTVAATLNFSFLKEPSGGVACNILLNADLTHIVHERKSQLHWVMKPDRITRFGIAPVLRMVRPWTQWLLVTFTPGTSEDPFRDLSPQSPELIDFVKEIIGDDSVDVEILRLDPWVVRETVAESYSSKRNVFLLGDAAHRHPPAFGLGSNTCIQDAYNLAWKVALVAKGIAGPALLDSYTTERQPVGAQLVRESNKQMVAHAAVWEALGMFNKSSEEGLQQINQLSEASKEGAARRLRLHTALEGKRQEAESVGIAMNQVYDSTAVYLDDEIGPRPVVQGDPIVRVLISSYPGLRLPHAWLDKPTRRKTLSTQDLAGHGSFCLITGVGGDAWRLAADKVSQATGVQIKTYGIGFGLDYQDIYREWQERREVEEDGCVLIRPDRFVAWRSMRMISDCESKLLLVLNSILSREESNVIRNKKA